MKKVMVALFLLIGSLGVESANAQVNVSINIGSQPAWGPTGYNHVDYYYFPDNNIYYDIARAQYIFLSGGQWIFGSSLPAAYGRFDPYNSYKVVVNEPNPYRNNKRDISRYAKYKGQHNQPVIRDSRDEKYYASKQHPQHQQWENSHKGTARNDGKSNNGGRGKQQSGSNKGHNDKGNAGSPNGGRR